MRNKEIFIGLLALVLAIPLGILLAVAYLGRIIVFYISFAWTASCRLEREMERAEIENRS